MNVLVTGGTGTVGRLTVARLIRHGHAVRVIGLEDEADITIAGGEYRTCDINDYAALCRQVEGIEGIVHLAAIPNPGGGSCDEIFRVNCAGTFNLYQAAAEAGIKRVVSASSINALGFNFGVVPFELSYFPLDEGHPCITSDAYSFSKGILEDTAAYFWRRDGISGVSLRLPGVRDPDRAGGTGRGAQVKKTYEEMLALPKDQLRERVGQIWEASRQMRSQRAYEQRRHRQADTKPDIPAEQIRIRRMVGGLTNFWSAVHAEDVAQAFEKGLTAVYTGSHPLFVNAANNRLGLPTEELARLFYPQVTQRTRPLLGAESLVSNDRARQLIGFEPECNEWD
jgi:nucleoside-diphosphate-sugar epimerase